MYFKLKLLYGTAFLLYNVQSRQSLLCEALVNSKRFTTATLPIRWARKDLPTEKYIMLGYGRRFVTFLSFHMYNCGIYVDESKLDLLETLWQSVSRIDTVPDWTNTEIATTLVDFFFLYSIPVAIRLDMQRATNSSHLENGFVNRLKKIMPETELLPEDVGEFRARFKELGTFKKGDTLTLTIAESGSIEILKNDVYISTFKPRDADKRVTSITSKGVGKGLLMSYLVGNNISSPELGHEFRLSCKTIIEHGAKAFMQELDRA